MELFLTEKLNMALKLINENNLRTKILKNTIYTLEQLLTANNIKKWFCLSYSKYEDLRELRPDLPSSSRIAKLEKTLSNLNLNKLIFDSYVNSNKDSLETIVKSIDSSFIFNQCCEKNKSFIGISKMYHNKFGLKLTNITNENGFPLYFQINSAQENDAKIAKDMLNNFSESLKGSTLLADTGYDSLEFKKKSY